VAKELERREQTPRNGIKAAEAGTRNGTPVNGVTPEQRARSRLRAEHVRLKREHEILHHAAAYVARDTL
jgi:transposase